FTVFRQVLVEVNVDIPHQRSDTLHQASIDGLKALRMSGDVSSKKMQKPAKDRITIVVGDLAQHNPTIRQDLVMKFVPLIQLERLPHGGWHRGLKTVSQRGFNFQGGSHESLQKL